MLHRYKHLILVWVALMVLLGLTCASAFLHMGIWNSVANLGIAVVKASLVGYFFMHLATERAVIRLCAAVALLTLALLFAISAADYATRTIHGAPWQAQSGSSQGG